MSDLLTLGVKENGSTSQSKLYNCLKVILRVAFNLDYQSLTDFWSDPAICEALSVLTNDDVTYPVGAD